MRRTEESDENNKIICGEVARGNLMADYGEDRGTYAKLQCIVSRFPLIHHTSKFQFSSTLRNSFLSRILSRIIKELEKTQITQPMKNHIYNLCRFSVLGNR